MRAAQLLAFVALAAACNDAAAPPIVPPHDNHIIDSTMMVPAPPLAASVGIPPKYGIHDTFIRDGIALVSAWNSGLMLYDVGNGIKGGSPVNPVLISSIVTDSNGVRGGAAVHNAWWFHNPVTSEKRYVFVGQEGPARIAGMTSGDIHVVDVMDLNSPREVAFYHMNVSPDTAGTHNFWMDEPAQILYAAYYNGGVVALDVSGTLTGDLASKEIARYQPSAVSNFVWGVQLSGGSLYAIDLLNGLYQLKLVNRTFTTAAGGGNVPERYSSDLWVNGQYAYTGTWGASGRAGVPGNTIKTWRLSASGAPTLADSLRFTGVGTISDVKGTDDGTLLIASAESGPSGGVYVFTLTDPTFPTLVGRVLVPGGVHTVKVADIGGKRYAFAAKNPGSAGPSLLIYDVTGMGQ